MQSIDSLDDYWSSPEINWFDYFVDRERFSKLLKEANTNRDLIARLAVQFAEQATTSEGDCETLVLKGFPEEDVEFSKRKSACLWLCAMSCLSALEWDFDFILQSHDVVMVRLLLEYVNRLWQNREVTADASFGEWLFARWVLAIDRKYHIPPVFVKQVTNNPLVVPDSALLRQEQVRKAVIETREHVLRYVQTLEKIVANGKALYVPGFGCFLQPFMEVGGSAMSIGLVGSNVLIQGSPKPNLTIECSLVSGREVASITRFELAAYYFSENNLLRVKDHLIKVTACVHRSGLFRLDQHEVSSYCAALGLPSPFPEQGTSASFVADQKLLTDDASVNRRLRMRRWRAERETSGQLQVAFRSENAARDVVDGTAMTVRSQLGDNVVNTRVAKSISRLLPRLSAQARRRLRGYLMFLCATVPGLQDQLAQNNFEEASIMQLAAPSARHTIPPPNSSIIKALLKCDQPIWTVLTSFEVNEIKDALATLQHFIRPRLFKFPELLGSLIMTRPNPMHQDFQAMLLSKLQQLSNLQNDTEWDLLCNKSSEVIMRGQQQLEIQMVLLFEAMHVKSHLMNASLNLPWKSISPQKLGSVKVTLKKLFEQNLQMIRANVHATRLCIKAVAFFLNAKEWEFVLTLDLTIGNMAACQLLAACGQVSGVISNMKKIAEVWVSKTAALFEEKPSKRRRDGEHVRATVLLRQEMVQFLKLIKEPGLLAFLISFFAHMFNRMLLADRKPQLRLFCQHHELFPESELNHAHAETIEECLRIVLRNGFCTNVSNGFWLRTAADYKYAKGELDEALCLYTETLLACRPSLSPPFPDNVVDDTLWNRLRVCLSRTRCHTLATLVCQFTRSKREEQYDKAVELLGSQVSLDAGAECSPMVWEVSLVERMSEMYTQNKQQNNVERLMMSSCDQQEMQSRKRPASDDVVSPPSSKREFLPHPETPHPYMYMMQQQQQPGCNLQNPAALQPMMFDDGHTPNWFENMGMAQMPLWMNHQLPVGFAYPGPAVTSPMANCLSSPPNGTSDSGISSASSSSSSDVSLNQSPPSVVPDADTSLVQQHSHQNQDQSMGRQAGAALPEDTFCHVQGRLCQVGSLRTYRVTKDEILRRVNQPECMNSSSIAAMLRKAKTKKCGSDLREQMVRSGITVAPNRRKVREPTSFTALVEEESVKMARDLDHIVGNEYPTQQLANLLCMSATTNEQRDQRRLMMQMVCQFFSELHGIIDTVRVPLAGTNPDPSGCDPNLHLGMQHLSAVTHGFAILDQRTWAKQFEILAQTALVGLNQQQSMQMPSNLPW